MLQLLVDSVPQTPCRGFAPGPHWETVSPDPLTHFAVHIFPKFTPMIFGLLSEIFNDTNHHTVFLRQLSFLFHNPHVGLVVGRFLFLCRQ